MLPLLNRRLAGILTGPIEYYDSVSSTNDIAADRLAAGAPDLTLIFADEQTAGRGRHGRSWHTPRGAALAFSLVLHPQPGVPAWPYTALGALAVHEALTGLGLPAAIKWPNDVLVGGDKVCGVLAEAYWEGSALKGFVLGIGVNVSPHAVPTGELAFPSSSVAAKLGRPVDRWDLLARILEALPGWRARLGSPDFIEAWERRLAYRGEQVCAGDRCGILVGLAPEGGLVLQTDEGAVTIQVSGAGVSLRPAGGLQPGRS